MNITLDMTSIREASARELADRIGCTVPDSPDSPGAKLLIKTRDYVLDNVKEVLADDYEPREVTESDRLSQIEEAVLPDNIDNDNLWRQFVDLGGWQDFWQDYNQDAGINLVAKFKHERELPHSSDIPTMTSQARNALYLIVNNLIHQLVDELQQQYDSLEIEDDDEA